MHRPTRLIHLLIAFLPFGGGILEVPTASAESTGFLDRSVTLDGTEFRYQVYVPREYSVRTSWPVILALHGSGEKGTDGYLQTEIGFGTAIRRHRDRYPVIVVFAQTPGIWQESGARIALAELDATLREFKADPDRVYLTGLSMGGNGVWYLGYHHPDRFAALVAVCGWIRERRNGEYPAIAPPTSPDPFAEIASRLAGIPVWIFHGEADDVVPAEDSRRMAAALRDAGGDVRYTELPGVNHNAWDPAYAREDLPVWLLAQRRHRRPRISGDR